MKKKLCYFVNSAWYFELHWLERAQAAYDAGYQVYIIANFSDAGIKTRLTEKGFFCIDSKIDEKSINPLLFLKDYIKTKKTLNAINPDILHSITIKPGVLSCLWCKEKATRLVYSFTGLGRVFDNQSLFYKMLKHIIISLYKYLFKKINYVLIFEHEKDQAKIISLLNISTSHTLVIDGAGVDINHFSYQDVTNKETPIVFFAARMLWSKGLQHLIKAKEILALRGVNFNINVAGILIDNDNDAIDIEQIEKWHSSGSINWLGSRSDIRELIAQSDLIALPSSYPEGIPRILLEAGAVGRPCVVYNNHGCNSLITDGYNGFVTDSIDGLADKIQYLITHEEDRIAFGKAARKAVELRYSSAIVIKKTLDVYSHFAAGG